MKKLLDILLCILLTLALCSCGQQNNKPNHDLPENTTSEPPVANPNTPSVSVIEEDLASSLQAENSQAHITENRMIKSLTDNSTYFISLSVSASTKYMNYEYEVDMNYTKYDQGWLLDHAEWTTIGQTLQFPDADTMAKYITDYLPNHDIFETNYKEYVLPVECPYLEETGERTLSFKWRGTKNLLHAEEKHNITSAWEYSTEIDDWILIQTGKESKYDYEITHHYSFTQPKALDFTGIWNGETNVFGIDIIENAPEPVAEINVTDFSEDGFNACINYTIIDFGDAQIEGVGGISHSEVLGSHVEKIDKHFSRVNNPGNNSLKNGNSIWFKSEDNSYICFTYRKNETEIGYYKDEIAMIPLIRFYVKQELPPL